MKDPREDIQTTGFEGLDVIPASIDLSSAEVHLVTAPAREPLLASGLRTVSAADDVFHIDCRPARAPLNADALTPRSSPGSRARSSAPASPPRRSPPPAHSRAYSLSPRRALRPRRPEPASSVCSPSPAPPRPSR
ncbi:ParA family protein [Clavibacter michiganensis]|uniref:ParA family protein n=1 Tax=Clavibacter michiganensis TaxID=28447 RepID=UPI00292E797F|nr:AAA family ATPase [Clavibacter michiganensis]